MPGVPRVPALKAETPLRRGEEFETSERTRAAIGAYIDSYHDCSHSGLNYRTPRESQQPGTITSDLQHERLTDNADEAPATGGAFGALEE